jgi:hypothetical protein
MTDLPRASDAAPVLDLAVDLLPWPLFGVAELVLALQYGEVIAYWTLDDGLLVWVAAGAAAGEG